MAIRVRERTLGRDSLPLLAKIEASQPRDLEAVRKMVEERRYAAALYAFQQSPLHQQRLIAAGVSEDDLRARRGWERIPVLEKADLQCRIEDLYARDFKGRCLSTRTTGSTGFPLKLKVDVGWPAYSMAAARRGQRWWGIEPGARCVQIYGQALVPWWEWRIHARRLAKLAANRICGVTFVRANAMNDRDCHRAVETVESVRPEMILAQGNPLFLVASYALRRSIAHRLRGVKAVFYSGEYLSTSQRDLIGKAFDCPVVSEYGAVETGVIAYGCPCGMDHVMHEFLDVEVLGEDGVVRPFGRGEAVVTGFHSRKLPLIRYRLGDLIDVVEGESCCPNGFVGKSIRSMLGRNNDVIYSPTGTALLPESLSTLIYHAPGVRRFQIVEAAAGQLNVLIEVPAEYNPAGVAESLASAMARQLREFRVSVRAVERIAETPNGKLRTVIADSANRPASAHVEGV